MQRVPAISNMVPETKQMRTLMYGSSGRNFTQSRPRSRVINPKPARISAVIINARVTTSFTGRLGQVVTLWSEEGNMLRHTGASKTDNHIH